MKHLALSPLTSQQSREQALPESQEDASSSIDFERILRQDCSEIARMICEKAWNGASLIEAALTTLNELRQPVLPSFDSHLPAALESNQVGQQVQLSTSESFLTPFATSLSSSVELEENHCHPDQ